MKKRFCALILSVALVASLATQTKASGDSVGVSSSATIILAPSFIDVPLESWYEESVFWAIGRGITNGTSATTFSPDSTCSKGQILTFLWRAYGSPEPKVSNPFSDVSQDAFYYKPALWAYEKNMVVGDSFLPEDPCTRSMAVTYLWKAAMCPQASITADFTDVFTNATYVKAVAWAVDNGITAGTGDGSTFSPEDICTRAQIVTFLYRDLGSKS